MLAAMGKEKTRTESRKPVKRTGKNLNVWIDDELRDLFAASAERNKRNLNAEAEIAISEYLAKRGLIKPGEVPD